jgi:putative ABC transport system permease protein
MMAATEPFGFTYTSTGGSEPQSLPGARVTQGFSDAFGMDGMYGRTFTPDEYAAGRTQVVVLSHGTCTRQFGGDGALSACQRTGKSGVRSNRRRSRDRLRNH